ncbi:sugar MFS transporter [Emticicia sp. C21]|uniref:sugar MFS transporter n=1 Tax=Emticicia sp. C21 TaxID=2302915 RepID=UPI000E3472AC|nr:sugar MFS transporter [Emticicia sp. C21]RFS14525.1 glucose/galactose MFS transporter [Emticicia sp. C21]
MEQNNKSYLMPLVMIGVLFFTFGYITWTNGTLIPFLKIACELETDTQAFLVTSAFYMSYFFLSIPSSFILSKVGFKNGMVIGLIIVALGSLIFIPAANSRTFSLFLTGLFVQGAGLSLLQTAVNPYVSILGPIESAAKRISIMGVANKFAGILAPIILGAVVLKGIGDLEGKLKTAQGDEKEILLNDLAQRINTPYIALAIFLILVAVLFWFSKLPEVKEEGEDNKESKTQKDSVFAFPNLILGVFAIIFYVGAEVIAGDGIGQYGKNIGISLDEAKNFTAYTLGAMLVGYFVGIIAIPKYIKQENALKYSAILGLIFTIAAIFTSGYTSVYCIALMGLSNALMWPSIFPLAIKGLGKFTKIGSALLIMGIGPGGGIIPLAYAEMGGEVNPQRGFWIMAICYIFILYFAISGHKKKSW